MDKINYAGAMRGIGIPRRHFAITNLDWNGEDKEQYNIISAFAKFGAKVRDNGYGLIIRGPYGTGKSYAASYVMKMAMYRLFNHPHDAVQDALYISATDFVKAVLRNDHETEDRATNGRILVLDDLGKESRNLQNDSGWAASILTNLVKYRTEHMLHTIITTNLSRDQLLHRYTEYFEEATRATMLHLQLKETKRSADAMHEAAFSDFQ